MTRAGPGGGVMVGPAMGAGMQQGARTSEYHAYCSSTQHTRFSKSRHKIIVQTSSGEMRRPQKYFANSFGGTNLDKVSKFAHHTFKDQTA